MDPEREAVARRYPAHIRRRIQVGLLVLIAATLLVYHLSS